jgi:hypothetical protein
VFNGNGGPTALGALNSLYLLSSAGLAVALNQLSGQSFASEHGIAPVDVELAKEALPALSH